MIFGPTPLAEAEDAILAHSLKFGGTSFKKGRRLSAEDIERLKAAGLTEVIAARLEAGDLHEDEAARTVAEAVAGEGVTVSAAFTGRCNLLAARQGLLLLDRERLEDLNRLDESLTLATLAPYDPVMPRQMLATVKVIPFAAPARVVERACALAQEHGPLITVAAFRPRQAGLVQTVLPGTKASLLDKTRQALDARLAALACPPAFELRCPHESAAVAEGLQQLAEQGCELLLVSGASAIVDRRDVVPEGVRQAGGEVLHFGMPVDPGNLLLLARLGERPLLGLPGCARSPKVNGFDWVLERLLADLPVDSTAIMAMGAGGLLKEIGSRPLPRAEAVGGREQGPRAPRIAAVLLAAGQARRMGGINKLLAEVGGETMVRRVLRAARASQANEVVVVTGHQREALEAALAGEEVRFVHNPDYAAGLSESLKRGVAALSGAPDGVVVLLGDMPKVSSAVIDRLIAAFDPLESRAICVPTWRGKRGNPVLFAARFFPEIQQLSGDIGARGLMSSYPELVAEVPMEDSAVLLDVDTPEALANLEA